MIDGILASRTDCKECKPVYEKYQKIFFKKTKEKFKQEHPEVARYAKAAAYLASPEIENIFENSDFILMLNQASGDRQILAKQLNISPHQLSYVTNSGEGEGLVFYGSTIIPFKDKFDNSLMLYALMTSKPDEVEKRKKLGIGERDD